MTQELEIIGNETDLAVTGAAQSETSLTLGILMAAAKDPNIKPENLERFLAMHRELLSDQRKEAFNSAMARLQPRLPRIKKNGRIEILDKQTGQVRQSTPFARYEDIDSAIRPLLQEEGFSISFSTEERQGNGGGIVVNATLRHSSGHFETASMPLPLDTSGSKNNIQGMGSSLTYGKRYLVTAMLNIVTEGEDKDGNEASAISEEQVNRLLDMKLAAEMNDKQMATYMDLVGVQRLEDITIANYPMAYRLLQSKVRAKQVTK